jgi:uncharacterized protein (TIGR01244 family)
MAITNVTPDYSVDGQIDASQVADIKASGFKTIICNRPDEESGAVAHAIIKKEAKKQGLAFHYMPIDGSGITADNVADFAKIWDQLEKPVLAYCRSGRRAEVVFQQAQLAKPSTGSGASSITEGQIGKNQQHRLVQAKSSSDQNPRGHARLAP